MSGVMKRSPKAYVALPPHVQKHTYALLERYKKPQFVLLCWFYPHLIRASFSHEVFPCNVNIACMCEWVQGSMFWEICTGNLPAQDHVAFPNQCRYGHGVNKSTNSFGRGISD